MSRLLKMYVRNILSEAYDRHICLDGSVVEVESEVCYNDICSRIEDATKTRDMCPMRSDARDYYNGVLKVLRRKHRKSKKFLEKNCKSRPDR